MRNRLYRSRDDRVIGGVAGGLAEWFDLDPSLVRVGWVVLALFSGGAFALIYLVMLIVVPEEPDVYDWDRTATPGVADPNAPTTTSAPLEGTTADTTVAGVPPAGAAAASTYPPATGPASTGWTDVRAQRRAERAARRAERRSSGPGSGGLLFGLILILVGGYFLLRQFVPQVDLELFWPIAVIALGALLLIASIRPGGRSEP